MVLGCGCFKKTSSQKWKRVKLKKKDGETAEETVTAFLLASRVKRSEMLFCWGTAGKPQGVSLAGRVAAESGERYVSHARSCDLQ